MNSMDSKLVEVCTGLEEDGRNDCCLKEAGVDSLGCNFQYESALCLRYTCLELCRTGIYAEQLNGRCQSTDIVTTNEITHTGGVVLCWGPGITSSVYCENPRSLRGEPQ